MRRVGCSDRRSSMAVTTWPWSRNAGPVSSSSGCCRPIDSSSRAPADGFSGRDRRGPLRPPPACVRVASSFSRLRNPLPQDRRRLPETFLDHQGNPPVEVLTNPGRPTSTIKIPDRVKLALQDRVPWRLTGSLKLQAKVATPARAVSPPLVSSMVPSGFTGRRWSRHGTSSAQTESGGRGSSREWTTPDSTERT